MLIYLASFTLFPAASYEINDIIIYQKMKNTSSTGFDDISEKIVIICADYIPTFYYQIFWSSYLE